MAHRLASLSGRAQRHCHPAPGSPTPSDARASAASAARARRCGLEGVDERPKGTLPRYERLCPGVPPEHTGTATSLEKVTCAFLYPTHAARATKEKQLHRTTDV